MPSIDPRVRRFARRIRSTEKLAKATANRPQIQATSLDDDAVIENYDDSGNLTALFGAQEDGTWVAISTGGPVPPVPSAPIVVAEVGGLSITWDGTFVGGEAAPADFAGVDVHIALVLSAANAANLAATFSNVEGGTVFFPLPTVSWDVGFVTRAQSAQTSALSVVVDETPLDPPVVPPVAPPSVAAAPTVLGGISSLLVSWAGVTSDWLPEYRVYVSVTSGFTPGAGTLVGSTRGSQFTVRQLTNGDTLMAGTTYYVKIVSSNTGGDASASPQGSGTPALVNSPDIAVNAITADQIAANSVTAEKLQAEMVLANKFIAGVPESNRVELDYQGLLAYDSANRLTARVSATSDSPHKFAGTAELDSATFGGDAEVRANLRIAPDAKILLQAGQGDPTVKPDLAIEWDNVAFVTSANPDDSHGLVYDAGTWYTSYSVFGIWNSTSSLGSFNGTTGVYTPVVSFSNFTIYGVTKIGSYLYILAKHLTGSRANHWWVYKYSTAGVKQAAEWEWGSWDASSQPYADPAIGNDGTNLVVARSQASGDLRIVSYVPDTGAAGSLTFTDYGLGIAYDMAQVLVGTFDFPGSRIIVFPRGSDPKVFVTSTGSRVSTEEWPRAYGYNMRGAAWDGTHFVSLNNNGQVHSYEGGGNKWTTASSVWWAWYAWRKGSVTYITKRSPGASVTMKKRARLHVSTPAIPGTGGASQPAAVSVYAAVGAAEPARTASWLQSAPADGVLGATITDLVATGTNPSDGSTLAFPVIGYGDIESGSALSYLHGDDTASFPLMDAIRYRSVIVHRAAAKNVTDSTYTLIDFDTEDEDRLNMHASGLFTIPANMGGWWRITPTIAFANNLTGRRLLRLNRDSATATVNPVKFCSRVAVPTSITTLDPSWVAKLTAGWVMRLFGWQNSTGTLGLDLDDCSISFEYLGP